MSTLLITGGGRGIGRAAAIQAATEGWRVCVNYVGDDEAAAETVRAIEAEGGTARAAKGDVADADAVARMFDAAQALGPVTGVVVNAGIVGPIARFADKTLADIKRVVDINVLGALYTAREAALRMSTAKGGPGGSMVIVSSAAARLGGTGEFVDYAATKGAMDTLTIGLSKELGPEGVRVNAVRPGLIETEIHASAGAPDRARKFGAGAPLGRAGTAEEVAQAICWLLSEKASYVTGALLDVAGGR